MLPMVDDKPPVAISEQVLGSAYDDHGPVEFEEKKDLK